MDSKIIEDIKNKYPEVGIRNIEVDPASGRSVFYVEPTKKSLAFIEASKGSGATNYRLSGKEKAATINRDFVQRTNLDLSKADPYTEDPKESFRRAIKYYYTDPMVGPTVNVLTSLAATGFENDIDDPNIKQFYDTWCFDVRFDEVLEWIFFDLFRVGDVNTYKVLAKYEPRVSYISPIPGKKVKTNKANISEQAAKKNIWSKGHLPIAYTVLNPFLVNITGNLLFDRVMTTLTLPQELSELLKKPSSEQTEEEKELIKALPPQLKTAAQSGGEYSLDSRLVGRITYRKQPYERYSRPRAIRVFDTIEYKNALKEADLSTLDGISNYILKVTIGNDEYPATTQAELEAIAALFNTPSKSFDVVWNHTLDIEKIVSPEIDKILGKGKYEQVNEDMTVGLAMCRALIDGGAKLNQGEAELVVKGITEEIKYARRQVTRWIYREYQQIAEAMGFDRFPKIRWDDDVLLNKILYMNSLAQMVDRRMLSYKTSLEALGYDYSNELKNMEEELPIVQDGIFGLRGSPWQQAKGIQPTQGAPTGTPSSGRPTGTTKQKETKTDPKDLPKQKPNEQKASLSLKDVAYMTPSEYVSFLDGARSILNDSEYYAFIEETAKYRFRG